jgi:hypothetical protein
MDRPKPTTARKVFSSWKISDYGKYQIKIFLDFYKFQKINGLFL